jgi:hypothetical protein
MFGGVHPVSTTDTSTAGLIAHLLLYFWASNFHDQGAHRGRMRCICRSVSDFGHQVREARASIALRRSFMEALFPFFGRPLEADATYCRRISLLASSGAFTFLVRFYL